MGNAPLLKLRFFADWFNQASGGKSFGDGTLSSQAVPENYFPGVVREGPEEFRTDYTGKHPYAGGKGVSRFAGDAFN